MNDEADYQFVSGPVSVLRDTSLTAIDRIVYFDLCARADKCNAQCWPSISAIANDLGVSERSVQYSIGRLVKQGLIKRTLRRNKSGDRLPSLYTVAWKESRRGSMLPKNVTQAHDMRRRRYRDLHQW
jgi:predicted transcriptional regulator